MCIRDSAKTSWPFSSATLNIAFGSISVTLPLNSKISSFDINYFFVSLYSIDLECPSRPSLSAIVIALFPISSIPSFVNSTSDIFFRKSNTDSPDENFALLDVGNTWLGPAT